ncbi:saccharopine dehydrogenase [Actinophytocola glycyrrhizae]|uniref:Saccharopine dehydrogenase n=1 Tax=Actinophytocola glycyrrhizae TaxID=2044873 RepID=A0ABV9RY07_9PSEU
MNSTVAVVGAHGHTARFVLTQLRALGLTPVPFGRGTALAFDGVAAVVNCAGPFADTAVPVAEAAVRAGAHYFDISAEQAVTMELLARFRDADVVVAPSVAFYGGLGDLLATAAMGDWPAADEIRIGTVLDSWLPTAGTRRTITRNAGRHVTYTGGQFVPPAEPSTVEWDFAAPIGERKLVELSTADQVTIAHHLRTPRITVHINTEPLADLGDPDTPPPAPADDLGRSAQTFHVEVEVRRGGERRGASASGRDIYAVTGPIVATAVTRVLDGGHTGARTAGQLGDPAGFLRALTPAHLTVNLASRCQVYPAS